jgi:hypothetical protein
MKGLSKTERPPVVLKPAANKERKRSAASSLLQAASLGNQPEGSRHGKEEG